MTQTLSAVRNRTPKTSHLKRLDIQGLRAIAVLAVVANHLTGFPAGGFVGVDVFFVISGFVITGVLGQLVSGASEAQASGEWRTGTENQLKALAPSGAKLVVVTAPPSGKPPATCATRTSSPRDCQYPLPQSFKLTAQAMLEAAKASGASLIDTREWFCSREACPAFAGGTPVKRDGVHTTKQYAVTLVPVFVDALARVG